MQSETSKRWMGRLIRVVALSAVYLYGYPSATIPYFVVDLLHVGLGVVATVLLLIWLARLMRQGDLLARLGWAAMTAGAVLGIVLIKIGTPLHLKKWLYAHIALCVVGVFSLASSWVSSKKWFGEGMAARIATIA